MFIINSVMPRRYAQCGFTLIELMIVIVILGLLASLVAPEMFSKVGSTQKKVAATQMLSFDTALEIYRLDVGDYPDNLGELRNSQKPGWDGPYFKKKIPLDPWNNAYQYRNPGDNGQGFYLASYGKDGQLGGDGDDEDIVHQ
jgi:general secretion pathway protein G